jgi:hypothetical protein
MYFSPRSSSKTFMLNKLVEGRNVTTYNYTIDNGKVIKIGNKIYDFSSLYPTVMGKPWRDK